MAQQEQEAGAALEPLDALREVAKAEGAYSTDPLTHAANTIENMQSIAEKASERMEQLIHDPRSAPSDFERDNMALVLNSSRYDNFSVQLLRLIAKADDRNRERLRLGFPRHVEAVERFKGEAVES